MAKRTVTYEKPGSRRTLSGGGSAAGGAESRGTRRRGDAPPFAWDELHPVGRGETFPLFAAGFVLAYFATLICYRKGYTLLYGDAVAHLAIARRILDAHWPGLPQLGGVWLPLPHLLMVPFVQKMVWWQSGLGDAPMSVLSYAFAVAGVWKLGRRLMSARWALVGAAFFALNANLLFLASTAMTEALFLALLVWSVVAAVESVVTMRAADPRARRWMLISGLLVMAMVFTRYDGWIVGAAIWCVLGWQWWQRPAEQRLQLAPAFWGFTLLCLAGPVLWLAYNAVYQHDWLDWMRGPYSAAAIERRTAPPGQHYRGWHNPAWALLFYMRTAQVDASFWETGWAVMAAALSGLWWTLWRRPAPPSDPSAPPASTARTLAPDPAASPEQEARLARRVALLLWVPLPFYVYSVAYGSVPIFIPQLWPHAYYNARYGMEMLPALALFAALAGWRLHVWAGRQTSAAGRIAARLLGPFAMVLCAANSLAMMYRVPLVLKEGIVNASTRVPFEHAVAGELQQMPPDQPVMMYTSAHVGAVQVAGRTLRSMVSEMDSDAWKKALADPAASAPYVIAIDGDPVAEAVKAHPAGLQEISVICTTGQSCARVYRSTAWASPTGPAH